VKIEDIEKMEITAKEHELLSDKAFTKGTSAEPLGLEKHRNQANHLRSICKELREKVSI
jgi:hypothetical protein